MLSYEEALARVLQAAPPPMTQEVALADSLGSVLAETVTADLDLPPFTKSFMDGFAVGSADTVNAPVSLAVIAEAPAGASDRLEIEAGQAVRIMTGAPVPKGADAVQMVERTRPDGSSRVVILEPLKPGENVAPAGDEVRKGQIVLDAGRVIGPAEIGALATFGRTTVRIFRAPEAMIFTTGSELVAIDKTPQYGQIRNSNSVMLQAQCRQLGVKAEFGGNVTDHAQDTLRALQRGLEKDFVVFSGGVSMGEHDYVHRVMNEAELEILFHKVAIRPGKPILAAVKGRKMIFCLPGNPVSCLVTFELFVRPAVRKWMGFEGSGLLRARGRLAAEVNQKTGRRFFKSACTRWTANGFQIHPIDTRGSADLTAFSRANSLLEIPAECRQMREGDLAEVTFLQSTFEGGEG